MDQGSNLVITKAVRERHKVRVKRQFCTKRNCLKLMETNRVAIHSRYL